MSRAALIRSRHTPDFALRIAGFVSGRPSPARRAQQGPNDPNP